MEKRLKKLRIATLLRTSFGSCSSRNLYHSLADSVFLPQPRPQQPLSSSSSSFSFDDLLRDLPKNNSTRSSSRCARLHTKCASEMMLPRQVSDRYPSSTKEDSEVLLRCPPASPITPLNPFLRHIIREPDACDTSSSSASSFNGNMATKEGGLFSSDDEEVERTSSDSSRERPRRRRGRGKGRAEEGSYAVVKSSRDPYGDFRRSMVEMIVEKRMYGADDLGRLLEWFLRLNEGRHHAVILRAFTDIWESLFFS